MLRIMESIIGANLEYVALGKVKSLGAKYCNTIHLKLLRHYEANLRTCLLLLTAGKRSMDFPNSEVQKGSNPFSRSLSIRMDHSTHVNIEPVHRTKAVFAKVRFCFTTHRKPLNMRLQNLLKYPLPRQIGRHPVQSLLRMVKLVMRGFAQCWIVLWQSTALNTCVNIER